MKEINGMMTETMPTEMRPIEVITAEIHVLKAQVGMGIMEIGNRLIEAKSQLSHGEWLPWLKDGVQFSESYAQRFMQLAKDFASNPAALRDLGMSKALALRVFSPEERDVFITEGHVVNGEEKTVEEMTTRELAKAIRERQEAVKAKEAAEVARLEAELAKEKMAQDMALAKAELETAQEESQEAEDRVAVLKQELEELRKQPTEIVGTAVPDAAALEAARAQGAETTKKAMELELNKKLEKAKDDAKVARDKLKELKDTSKEIEARTAAENKALSERVATLEKQLKVSDNKTLTSFQVCFETVQEDFCKMLGFLQKIKLAGNMADHDKLVDATHAMLMALADKVPGKAGGSSDC